VTIVAPSLIALSSAAVVFSSWALETSGPMSEPSRGEPTLIVCVAGDEVQVMGTDRAPVPASGFYISPAVLAGVGQDSRYV